MYRVTLIIISFLCHFQITNAQKLTNAKIDQIDQLFKKYTTHTSPGYALGIIENGELIYTKGYGLSNLDYNIPITDSSAFYIGSMAKQFTAAALLILEEKGAIDLNRSVHYYLPEFPKYDTEITINHLIHHTSGIRETNSLQLFQGIDLKFEEVFDTESLYKLVIDQKALNFQTGNEYRYSSGGYAVLAKLIEKISKQPFREFLEQHLFQPLGMKDTFVSDNHNEIVKNRAVSYWPIAEGKYERRSQVFDAYGDGGIITTVNDLALWDKAFYKDILGVKNFADKMYAKGKLNNGKEIEYARALQIRTYKGLKMITHNGGMLGFRVDMVRFPEVKTSFILLGNSAYLDPTGDILKIADIYLKEKLQQEPVETSNHIQEDKNDFKIDKNSLKDYTGYYWTDDTNYFRRISIKNDSLFLDSGNPDYAQYLKPLNSNEFIIKDFYIPNKLVFNPEIKGNELTATFGDVKRRFRKFDPTPPQNIDDLKKYEGIYYSQELSASYTLYIDTGQLYLKINNKKPVQIFPVPQNSRVVWNGKEMFWLGFGEVKFTHNKNKTVTGLLVGDGRVSGVTFKKQ